MKTKRPNWQDAALHYANIIAELKAALRPFAKGVYNDNGAMTVSPAGHDDYVKAYHVFRRMNDEPALKDPTP